MANCIVLPDGADDSGVSASSGANTTVIDVPPVEANTAPSGPAFISWVVSVAGIAVPDPRVYVNETVGAVTFFLITRYFFI